MTLINEAGVYLGYAPTHGVDRSSGGYPQLVLQCEATHKYDEEVGEYIEVSDLELRAYFVLYGKDKKPLRNCEQVKKVFDWKEPLSFQTLAEKDLSGIRFMFRVEEHTWDGDTKLQVSWIDVEGANPTRSVSSLDVKDLQKLDAAYGLVKAGKKTGTKAKPKGAPIPPKASPHQSTLKETGKKKVSAEKTKVQTATEATQESGPPASGPPAPVAVPKEEKTGSTTREAAWDYLAETIPERALPAEERANAWNEAIEKIHDGPDDDTLTGEEWFKVQKLIVSETIPF